MEDSKEESSANKQIGKETEVGSEINISEIQLVNNKPKQENTDMEVHHHSHAEHGKKNWRSYFWEFLMLFLAVFCGFLAENQREHMVEHNREKQFAQSLVEDLKNDIVELKGDIPTWEAMIDRIDTIRHEIDKEPAKRNLILMYRNAALLITNNNFFYHDRTIGQLKNSGSFRLIRNRLVSDSLIEYDATIISGIKDLEVRYNVTYFQNREVLQEQLFNSKFFSLRNNFEQLSVALNNEPEVMEIRKGKEDVLFSYYNSLFALQFQTNVRLNLQKVLLGKANDLIELINKEYGFE